MFLKRLLMFILNSSGAVLNFVKPQSVEQKNLLSDTLFDKLNSSVIYEF